MVGLVALLGVALWVGSGLGTNLVPDLAQGEFAFQLRLPEGSTLQSTVATVDRVESMLVDDPAFAKIFSITGTTNVAPPLTIRNPRVRL